MEDTRCDWLDTIGAGYGCRLRTQKLPIPEVTQKCLNPDLAVMCVDAYSSLSRGQESLDADSTDALPWLIDSASQFENLGELDNAVTAIVKAIDYAIQKNLLDQAYSFYAFGRSLYERGKTDSDASLSNSSVKKSLLNAGMKIVESAQKGREGSPLTDMQAELKASLMSGVSLKKATKEEGNKDLIVSHGRALYEKKAKEYKEGADKYVKSGMAKNSVVFACMGALSDLMLGKLKEGMSYLAELANQEETGEVFQDHPCFEWTKQVFKAMVDRNAEAMDKAQTLFLSIPWSYKEDKELARRIMDSVTRRIKA
ncbi:MAG: hypothetical protein KAQ65_01050 [Candidatus Thorarchaeota archaeon]|nr:hypothetical protein [Candidatus Thorarchaeota archaeon]MCK5237995.1 hypothetical protein [Candidatus Thorarchaeota archaeon]